MNGIRHRGERQHIAGEPPPVRLAADTFKGSIIGTVTAAGVDFLVRLSLLKLWVVSRGLLIEHQNVLRLFQRSAAGVEKPGASALVPHPLIAEHGEVGRAQRLVIGTLGKQKHRALGLHRPAHRLPQLRQGQGNIPIIPRRAVGRIGQKHIHRMTGQGAQPLNPVHQVQALRGNVLASSPQTALSFFGGVAAEIRPLRCGSSPNKVCRLCRVPFVRSEVVLHGSPVLSQWALNTLFAIVPVFIRIKHSRTV